VTGPEKKPAILIAGFFFVFHFLLFCFLVFYFLFFVFYFLFFLVL